jgi:hypothetical protein
VDVTAYAGMLFEEDVGARRVAGRRKSAALLASRLLMAVNPTSFRVWGLGFRVWGLGFGVLGLGFGVLGFGFRVSGFGFRV